MSQLAARMSAVAERNIAAYGRTVVYVAVEQGPYDPETGAVASASVSTAARALISEPNAAQISRGMLATDLVALMPAAAFKRPPRAQDQLVFDGITYRVQGKPTATYVGDTAVAWELQVRA